MKNIALFDRFKNYYEKNMPNISGYIYHYSKIMETNILNLNSHKILNQKNNDELKCGIKIVDELLNNYDLTNHNELFTQIKNNIIFYTASFSRDKNSSILKNKYGNKIIPFKTNYLKKYIRKRNMMIGCVLYNKETQTKLLNGIFKIFNLHGDKTDRNDVRDLFTWLYMYICIFKDKNHSQDHEVRLIGSEINNNGSSAECIKFIHFN
jgi:hypothetical protein